MNKSGALSRLLVFLILAAPFGSLAGRETYNFNTHWLYQIGEAPGFESPAFNDSGWEEVGLPHTLKLEPMRFQRGQSFYRGLGCYRRHFTLPPLPAGSHLLVRFEAVMTRADVWVNGRSLGYHLGGFTPFDFDITEAFQPGQDNLIAVQVDNREMKEVPPEGGVVGYTLFGGMVRDVRLEVVPAQFIVLTKIENPGLAEGQPRLALRTWIQNFSSSQVPALVRTELRDPNGNVLAAVSSRSELAPQAQTMVEQTSEPLPPLHLWSPEEPYLYTVTTTVQAQGEDAIATAYGFRYFRFDPDQGFFLNGQHLKLIGHNRHQMYPHIGNAVPNRYQVFDAQMLKASGANFARLSHYPQDPAFLDACDRLGLFLFAEPPGWNHLGDAAWKDLAETMLREMIKRDWNHPSVLLWGVRINESPNDLEFHTRMNRAAKELDSTRPTSGARTFLTHGEYFEDVIAVNDYSGFILPREEAKPFLISEYGAMNYVLPPHATEEELLENTGWYLNILNLAGQRPWVAGSSSWQFQDNNTFMPYWMCPDCQGHIRDEGLVNLHRLPRPRYFFFRSQQDQEPMVYIANRWQKDSPRDVTVFGNCQEVELSLNGQVIGRQAPDASYRLPPRNGLLSRGAAALTFWRIPDRKKINSTDGLQHPPFTFRELAWSPGELRVRCYQEGKAAAEDAVRTPGEPALIQLDPDYSELVADGADLTRVVVSVRDRNGTLVPEKKRLIELRSEGQGRLIGDQPLLLENGLAAVYLQAGMQPGDLEFSAASKGLPTSRLRITTRPLSEPTVPLPASKQ